VAWLLAATLQCVGERGAVRTTLSQRLNLPSLAVVLWMLRRMAKGQNPDRPEIVSVNAASKPVLDRAKQLAGDGREDVGAVAELRTLARGKARTLRRAERASRFCGYHRERRRANLAYRLLRAAVADAPVAAVPPVDSERIEAVEAFWTLPWAERWTRLTALEPRLSDLEAEVEAGRFGEIRKLPARVLALRERQRAASQAGIAEVYVSSSDHEPPPTEQEMRELREHGRRQRDLEMRLTALVGPDSAGKDSLLGSQSAFDLARGYLVNPNGWSGSPLSR
jgi:hypothetical protein